VWFIALYGAETWTFQKVEQKYLEGFEVWCWRRMEKIIWTDRVRNEEVLQRIKGEKSILDKIKMRRNCLLKHIIEGKDRRKNRNDGKTRKKT
jgi:hypothetical protein